MSGSAEGLPGDGRRSGICRQRSMMGLDGRVVVSGMSLFDDSHAVVNGSGCIDGQMSRMPDPWPAVIQVSARQGGIGDSKTRPEKRPRHERRSRSFPGGGGP